ncbi:phosphoglycerate mutase-like protein [Annulohypoxylon maeteangense]|uniref:phosphoglycerate mutase-like protein n=1 Tax=Annulohypoxylon maeteangense TaxID=1927788 RepID=UPI0020072ED4|nr:phosphoglycerate mutase-like protein [Annulohypoxylon maeteangense]KAI0889119.1 phosphoglycerate mutase-like protein [Annulohypoxylon maeteangense]
MAPNSRLILTRHAQAEHNVDSDYWIPDAPLTPLGKKQAASLSRLIPDLQKEADVVISSPLRRTLQTTYLGYAPAIERLGGLKNVVVLPQAQECNNMPCDTGSSKEVLESIPEFAVFDLTPLTPDWNSKEGFWAPTVGALTERAQWVRKFLRDRPEKNIVFVSHGDILRRITTRPGRESSDYPWQNAEVRIFEFDPEFVDSDECFLYQKENVAAAGGYGLTSTELEIEQGEGRL